MRKIKNKLRFFVDYKICKMFGQNLLHWMQLGIDESISKLFSGSP